MLAFLSLSACGMGHNSLKAQAERFFRGVYGCDATVVDELASADVVLSYPIFQQLYGTPAIAGRDAVKDFAKTFCSRWSNARISFHEAIAEGDRVVLVWSYSARFEGTGEETPGLPPVGEEQSWGGISLFIFNENGEIEAEIGEESSPGPIKRIRP